MSLLSRRLQKPQQIKRAQTLNDISTDFRFVNGRLIAYDDNLNNYIVKGFNINDIVYSIVKIICDKCRLPQWGLYQVKDTQAYKSYLGFQSGKSIDINRINEYRQKALSPVQNPGKWGSLLEYPNSEEDFSTLIANSIAFTLLTGNKYISGIPLSGGANQGIPNELWNEPAQWVDIISNGRWPARPEAYQLRILPDQKWLPSQMLHGKYFNPNYDINGNHLYGQSPIRAGLQRLQKSNLQLKAEASSWENEGIKGVFAFKVKPGEVDGETMQSVVEPFNETMRTQWQGARNRGKMGTSGYDLSWIPVGLSSEEMELIESSLVDLRMICNWFGGFPSQIMNDPKRSTYNTVTEAEKAMTVRCALPELYSVRNQFNRQASQFWNKPKGTVLDFDLTCFPELQASAKEVSEWTKNLVVIIPNEQRELVGLSAIDDPLYNEPWVLQAGTWVPQSEMNANAVDNALNDNSGENIQQ